MLFFIFDYDIMILEVVWTLCPLIKILKMSNTWSKSILLQLVSVVCVQTNSLQMEVFFVQTLILDMFNASLLEREIKNFAAFRIFRWNNGTETEKSKLSKDKSRMNGDVRNQFIFYRNVKICLLLLTLWHNRKNTNLCMQSFSKNILD